MTIFLLIAIFVISIVITWLTEKYASAFHLVHSPNSRSFHAQSTPHGGGIGLVVAFTFAVIFQYIHSEIHEVNFYQLVVLGLLVALTGLWDDVKTLDSRFRLVTYLVLSFVSISLLDELPLVHIFGDIVLPTWLVTGIVVVALTWWINLFNFMDGIDGIASVEILSILFGIYLLSYSASYQPENVIIPLATFRQIVLFLMVAVIGFLFLNWPPAKIFMGDVGSTFLGYTSGILAILSVHEGYFSVWTWLILGGVFWVDATYTLLTRMVTGQKFWQAHRSHAYQYATQRIIKQHTRGTATNEDSRAYAHRYVSLLTLAINIVWLFPLAYIVRINPDFGIYLTALAWAPLIITAHLLRAGRETRYNE